MAADAIALRLHVTYYVDIHILIFYGQVEAVTAPEWELNQEMSGEDNVTFGGLFPGLSMNIPSNMMSGHLFQTYI